MHGGVYTHQLDALRDLCVAELVRTISPSTCVQLLHEAVLRSATDPTRYWAWLKEAAMATFRSALATTRSRTGSPRVSFHDSPGGDSPHPQEGAESFCAATFASLDPLVVMELLHTREILAASDDTRTLLIAQCLQPWGLRHFGTATPWEVRAWVHTTRGVLFCSRRGCHLPTYAARASCGGGETDTLPVGSRLTKLRGRLALEVFGRMRELRRDLTLMSTDHTRWAAAGLTAATGGSHAQMCAGPMAG